MGGAACSGVRLALDADIVRYFDVASFIVNAVDYVN